MTAREEFCQDVDFLQTRPDITERIEELTIVGWPDAYYELDLNPWDHAAGALVAAEAGLVLGGLAGRPFADPMAVAVAPSIAGSFLDLLAELHR